MRLRRSSLRLAWVSLVNGVSIFGLVTGGFTVNNVVLMTALLAGIGLELGCSLWAAVFNVGAFLIVPMGWVWERALLLFVLPCSIVAGVNLFWYVAAFRQNKLRR